MQEKSFHIFTYAFQSNHIDGNADLKSKVIDSFYVHHHAMTLYRADMIQHHFFKFFLDHITCLHVLLFFNCFLFFRLETTSKMKNSLSFIQ